MDPQDARSASVVDRALAHASLRPDATALISDATVVSYGQLAAHVRHVAGMLGSRGVVAGDRVLVRATSSVEFVATYFALHASGAVAVPVDGGMPDMQCGQLAERVAARLVLTRAEQASMLASTGAERRQGAIESLSRRPIRAEDAADILFTSGTTGLPKGVVLSHGNLVAAANHINRFVGTRNDDIEVLPLPLSHSFGLGGLRCAISVGATVVLVEGFAFPGRVFEALANHRATGFRCVAAGIAMMLRFAPDRLAEFASRLRYIEFGSAPMPLEHKQRLMALLPHTRICMHYGLTEATRSAFVEFHPDRERLHSIGRPSDGVEIRLVGEDGRDAARGGRGEIRIRGPHVMKSYWEDASRTDATLVDGWLRTGDVASADDGGYLYLHGRLSDMINVGGRKVAPSEVEDALRQHPAVLDCACSGIDDPAGISGEVVGVLVLVRDGASTTRAELRNHLRSRLEPYKLPAKWVFSGVIPRTANGKVIRRDLRAFLERSA